MDKRNSNKSSKYSEGLKHFNLVLFIITSLFLLALSISKGFISTMSFLSIFSIGVFFFTVCFMLSRKLNKVILETLIFLSILFNYVIIFLGYFFLEDLILMNYSMFDISFSLIPFFLNNILGLTRLIILVGIFGIFGIIALMSAKKQFLTLPYKISDKIMIKIIFISILIFLSLNFGMGDKIYNPYTSALSASNYGTKIPLNTFSQSSTLLKQNGHNDNFNSYDIRNKKYRYSFVFIMEQTSLEDFYREKEMIKTDDFFDRVKDKTHFFNNYYTSNQDSRTAIWEMLNSFFIPMECYIEPWQDYYGYVLETNNLISYLKENNVEPYSVSSVGGGSLILGIYPFNKFIRMYDYENEKDGYLCSTQFSYTKACEDFAIFDSLKQHIIENREKDLFYFQEMIFGHGEYYMDLSGKTRVEYYNDYFNRFYNFLKEDGILNESIIVIVADHGPKGGAPRVIEDFNIPFMVISENLEFLEIEKYYSHLSFKDIFFSYYLGTDLPTSEEIIYVIDQSGRDKRGYVDVNNNYSILGELSGNSLFLDEEIANLTEIRNIGERVGELLLYEDYIQKLSVENHTHTYIP